VNPKPTYREVGRPTEWRDKQHLCQWIADAAGVPVSEVVEARRTQAEQRGELWRPDDPVDQVRRKVLARLRNSTNSTNSTRATPTRAVAVDTPTSSRAGRMIGPLK